MITDAAAMVLLGAASITDIKSRKIPNGLTVSSTGLGLLYYVVTQGISGLWFSGSGMLLGFLLLLLLYLFKVVGAGDVKLFAALGAWAGAALVWSIFVYSILIGGMIGLFLLLYHFRSYGTRFAQVILVTLGLRNLVVLKEHLKRPATFPFMIAVFPAALVAYFIG
ncbi:prepilin peptidase [Paenibacillus aquistagni]|uniref:prepilin peptidase n=1 Tax=Paenibacillus aquistagni TaxID=1852522 RepID=UPI000B50E3B7|nr:prepilin peptidase [Paenibacillus aquistagni]